MKDTLLRVCTRFNPLYAGVALIGWGLLGEVSTSYATPALNLNPQDMIVFKDLAERSYADTVALNHMSNNTVDGGYQTLMHNDQSRDFHKTYLYAQGKKGKPSVGTVYRHPHYCVVALHGSHWLMDWIIDTVAALPKGSEPASTLHPDLRGHLHKGFAKHAYKIYPALEELTLEGHKEIVFTGHSLGGALAILLAARFQLDHPHPHDGIKVVTFSAPVRATGDAAFGHYLNTRLGADNILSFTTQHDVVSQGPWHPLGHQLRLGCVNASLIRPFKDKVAWLTNLLADPGAAAFDALTQMTPQEFFDYLGGSKAMGTSLLTALKKYISNRAAVSLAASLPLGVLATYILTSLHAIPSDDDLLTTFGRVTQKKQRQVQPAWHDDASWEWKD